MVPRCNNLLQHFYCPVLSLYSIMQAGMMKSFACLYQVFEDEDDQCDSLFPGRVLAMRQG